MRDLPLDFIGRGPVRKFNFHQLHKSENAYVYKVTTPHGTIHYETFERKENRRYDVISYPSEKAFGIWAWTSVTLDDAMERFKMINEG